MPYQKPDDDSSIADVVAPLTGRGEVTDPEIKLNPLAGPRGTAPQPKKIGQDTKGSRVVVVSPYGPLNVYLESLIPKIISGGEADLVQRAETNGPQYINVDERESQANKPYFIIDLGKIIASQPSPRTLFEVRGAAVYDLLKRAVYGSSEKSESEDPLLEYPVDEATYRAVLRKLKQNIGEVLDQRLADVLRKADASIPEDKYVDRIVAFEMYRRWAQRNEVTVLTPKPDFSSALESRCTYDAAGNFEAGKVNISEYVEAIRRDLILVVEGYTTNLMLFDVTKNKHGHGLNLRNLK